MARPVYSVRFLAFTAVGTGSSLSTVIPSGKRGVVKWISFVNAGQTNCECTVRIGGHLITWFQLPATTPEKQVPTSHVVYEGETVTAYSGGQASAMAVSGYLLEAPAGLEEDDLPQVPGPAPPGMPSSWVTAETDPAAPA